MRISRVKLDSDVVAWLHAVGLSEGEVVTVLRHAALGGPLHVRTSSGGEFAIAKEIAEKLSVESEPEPESESEPEPGPEPE